MIRNRSKSRRGAAAIIAVTCLLLASIFLVVATRSLVLREQERERTLWEAQTRVLAQSAIERASTALADDPDYAGEVWDISAEELDGSNAGRLTIEITVPDDAGQPVLIRAEAEYPVDSLHVARSEATATVARAADADPEENVSP
jgi:hypothetical protein